VGRHAGVLLGEAGLLGDEAHDLVEDGGRNAAAAEQSAEAARATTAATEKATERAAEAAEEAAALTTAAATERLDGALRGRVDGALRLILAEALALQRGDRLARRARAEKLLDETFDHPCLLEPRACRARSDATTSGNVGARLGRSDALGLALGAADVERRGEHAQPRLGFLRDLELVDEGREAGLVDALAP